MQLVSPSCCAARHYFFCVSRKTPFRSIYPIFFSPYAPFPPSLSLSFFLSDLSEFIFQIDFLSITFQPCFLASLACLGRYETSSNSVATDNLQISSIEARNMIRELHEDDTTMLGLPFQPSFQSNGPAAGYPLTIIYELPQNQ